MSKELARVEGKRFYNYKRRWGDRYDGWRVRGQDPFFTVIPHIMNTRLDSQVYFKTSVDIAPIDAFIRNTREATEMKDLTRLMVIIAALIRVYAKYPKLNRFVRGNRIYSHNSLRISMAVKKKMSLDGTETVIKPSFTPDATVYEVWEILHREIHDNKGEDDSSNGLDRLVKLLNAVPGWVLKIIVGTVKLLDDHGLNPKAIEQFSPFHTSCFVTDIGSVGIDSIYHHLYNFGTCSEFLGLGRKVKTPVVGDDGQLRYTHMIDLKIVIDERITDGFYYARSLRYLEQLLKHPEKLLLPPEELLEDSLD